MRKILFIMLFGFTLFATNIFAQNKTNDTNSSKSSNRISCWDQSLKMTCTGDVDLGESMAGITKTIVGPNNKIQFYLYNCDYCCYYIDINSINTSNKVTIALKWKYYYKTCGYIEEYNFKKGRYSIRNGLYINVYATKLTIETGAQAGPRNFMQEIIVSYSPF